MAARLHDIIVAYIDEALDIDDLGHLGDLVHSELIAGDIDEWQAAHALRQLHADLLETFHAETGMQRKLRLQGAILLIEADFSDCLSAKETGAPRAGSR